jgi:hypothetical protein
MPGSLGGWRITYHAVDANGKPVPQFGSRTENVAVQQLASDALTTRQYDLPGIITILVANGRGAPAGATLVVDSVTEAGLGLTL